MSTIVEVKEKMRSLLAKAPFSNELKETKQRLDVVDFAFSNLNLDGSRITRAGVNSILDENVIYDIPVKEHRLIGIHKALLSKMDDWNDMKKDVDISIAEDVYKAIAETDTVEYRKGNPVLYHLDFVPADYLDIRDEFAKKLKQVDWKDYGGDFCAKAATFHMEVIRIYPFNDYTEMLARSIMQYIFISNGLFPISLKIDEVKYNNVISEALLTGSYEEFAEIIRQSIILKLDYLIEKATPE